MSCFGGGIFGGGLVCYYGMPRNVSGTVTGEIDGLVKGIPGIQVTAGEKVFVTNENGYYNFFPDLTQDEVTITFTDIDGEQNGSFQSDSISINFDKDSWENNNIQLKNKAL